MIDSLFGSKTRVKLLHLFLNNPGKSFYVREITRLIDEQINSVRRELSNMITVGIITSDTADNKLYYHVNQRYKYYLPFRAIFADQPVDAPVVVTEDKAWYPLVAKLGGLKAAVAAGVLVKGSRAPIDLLIIGVVSAKKMKQLVTEIEDQEGREINYSVIDYDEFYYRLSIHDRFVSEIFSGRYEIIADPESLIKQIK